MYKKQIETNKHIKITNDLGLQSVPAVVLIYGGTLNVIVRQELVVKSLSKIEQFFISHNTFKLEILALTATVSTTL